MKKISKINNHLRVDGYYIKDVVEGFWDDEGRGYDVLEEMGLFDGSIPFDVAEFLRKGEIYWKDFYGRIAYMSFEMKDEEIVCFASYLGNKKTIYSTRYLEGETPRENAHADSFDIGNTCMLCFYEMIFGDDG